MKKNTNIKNALFNNAFFSNLYTRAYKFFDRCWMNWKYGDSYDKKQFKITQKKYNDNFFNEFERAVIAEGIEKALEMTFVRLDRCVQGTLNERIRYLIRKQARLEFDNDLDIKNEELIQVLQDKRFGELEQADWGFLERLLLINAFFRAALICRNKMIEGYANSKSSRRGGIERFAALFELERYEEAKKELYRFKRRHLIQYLLKNHVYGEFKLYELLLKRTIYTNEEDIENAVNAYKKSFKDDDLAAKYRRMVEGRNILLSGPAPTPLETLDDALVVKINYFRNTGEDEKVDISYYNGDRSANLVNLNPKEITDILRITKCRDRKFPVPNVRTMIWYNTLGVNTAPLMVPLFLVDMMRFNASRIKITGINLYMSSKRYNADYEKNNSASNDKFISLSGFAWHNGLSQFIFMKNLYKNHFFEADKTLDTILSMSDMEYAKEMENVFR